MHWCRSISFTCAKIKVLKELVNVLVQLQATNLVPILVIFPPHSVLCMMTSSNGNVFCVTGHLCGEFTGHRWIPCTKASDVDVELWCFLWSAWINGWVNKHEAADLRRHHAHYDIIVMFCYFSTTFSPLFITFDNIFITPIQKLFLFFPISWPIIISTKRSLYLYMW